MFPIVRYFSLVSAVVVGLAMVAVTIFLTQISSAQLVEERENANVGLTRVFSSSLWTRFRSHVQNSADLDGDALRAHPQFKVLQREVRQLMAGLSVVKVKVYALNGNTVFSTEAAQMGDRKSDNPGFLSARDGIPISEYSNRAKFSAFENEVFDIDVVSSYIPIRDDEGRVEAVFEVYDNVTGTLQKVKTRRNTIIMVVAALFTILYLALLLVVRRAAKIMQRQHEQILDAKTVLEQTNEQLFGRTEELKAVQATLVQKERLATLGELTATVSHELRNPLAAIRTSIHLALKKTEGLDLGVDRPLERAERNIVRCDAIISDLLGFASEPVSIPELMSVDDWLNATLDELSISTDVNLVRRLSAPNAQVNAIPDRIRQVIVNLTDNAVQALAGLPVETTPVLTVRTDAQAEFCKIVVEDNGPGIDRETANKVFEPLYSTKSYGCGLGLATVKKIIEGHGGTVDFESTVGVGSKVTVKLPTALANSRAA